MRMPVSVAGSGSGSSRQQVMAVGRVSIPMVLAVAGCEMEPVPRCLRHWRRGMMALFPRMLSYVTQVAACCCWWCSECTLSNVSWRGACNRMLLHTVCGQDCFNCVSLLNILLANSMPTNCVYNDVKLRDCKM